MKPNSGLDKLKRLGRAVGVPALAAVLLAGCAAVPGERPRVGAGFDIRAGQAIQTDGPPTLSTVNPDDTRIGRSLFGTVNPGARPGRMLRSQHLIGQLPFGITYDDGAARTTERREAWMDRVSSNNNAYRAGRGQALMVGIDASNPILGARDMVETYERLWNYVASGSPAERESKASVLLESYRDTMAARQDTGMLLQAEPRIEHFQDYARLEAGRRVLGDVLVRAGVMVERTVKADTVNTHGFLAGTAVGLTAYQGPNFGPTQVLLADDNAQWQHRQDPMSQVENRAVAEVYRGIQYQAQRYNQLQAERARQGLGSAPPVRQLR